MDDKIKVLGTLADESGCGWYRMVLPMTEMNVMLGHQARVTHYLTGDLSDPMYDSDLLVVQRMCDPPLAHFALNIWKGEFGRKVVYELDDLVTHLHPTNTMARDYYDQGNRLEVIKILLENVDAITTTTPTLADELGEYNDKVYVLPNQLPTWAGTLGATYRPPDEDGPVKIVYAGGNSHHVDAKHFRYGIGKTIKRLGAEKAMLFSFGHPWGDELGMTSDDNIRFVPWIQDFVAYQQTLLNYDIGLAPLFPNRFNRSKSDIKVLEYWAAGVVPIVSDLDPYNGTINNGVDGFLCRNDQDWSKYIKLLVDDADLREEMRQAGYERARERTIAEHAQEWVDAYREVLDS